jgi:hypothetical protein
LDHAKTRASGWLAVVDDVQTFSGETRAAGIVSILSRAFEEEPNGDRIKEKLGELHARFRTEITQSEQRRRAV